MPRDLVIFGPACPQAGTELCRIDDLIPFDETRASLSLSFKRGRDQFDLIIVREGTTVLAYEDRCPHAFARLGEPVGEVWTTSPFQTAPHLFCAIHDAQFRFEDGHCISGPCRGKSLRSVPVTLLEGRVLIG